MSTITMLESVEAECICGGKVVFGITTEDEAVVMHNLPQCADYQHRNPMEYLKWLQARFAKRS